MSSRLSDTLDQFRQPEYIGESRCTPCTVLNVAIAVILAAAIALAFPPAGIAAFLVFLSLIYLRGYLIPGTPGITQRYFPNRALQWFEKAPAEEETKAVGTDGGLAQADRNDVGETLLAAGVVEECPDDDDLCLSETFEEVWWRRIRQVRDEELAVDRLASVLEVDPAELTVRTDEGSFDVVFDGATIGRWTSRATFLADLAVEPTLAEWVPDWEEFDDRQRTRLIASMRVFLEECPSCDAALDPIEDVRKSCCSNDLLTVSLRCESCESTVFNGSYR